MKLIPLADRVVVEVFEQESVSKGGIILPDNAKEEKSEGAVIAIGSSEEIEVKKGDRVIFSKWGGDDVMVDGVKYKILKCSDILAKVA